MHPIKIGKEIQMAKFKKLPETEFELLELLQKLKDKEMRLEADLAIKDHPQLETPIAHMALAIAEVKKLDGQIVKVEKPMDKTTEVNAAVTRIQYLRGQLQTAEEGLKSLMPDTGNKLLDLASNRQLGMNQLSGIYAAVDKKFKEHGIDLAAALPSITEYIKS